MPSSIPGAWFFNKYSSLVPDPQEVRDFMHWIARQPVEVRIRECSEWTSIEGAMVVRGSPRYTVYPLVMPLRQCAGAAEAMCSRGCKCTNYFVDFKPSTPTFVTMATRCTGGAVLTTLEGEDMFSTIAWLQLVRSSGLYALTSTDNGKALLVLYPGDSVQVEPSRLDEVRDALIEHAVVIGRAVLFLRNCMEDPRCREDPELRKFEKELFGREAYIKLSDWLRGKGLMQ